MKLRPVLFWSHLAAGVTAGLVILMMSVTGVLLTYERQIEDWVDQRRAVNHPQGSTPVSIDDLVARAHELDPDAGGLTFTIANDPTKVVKARIGRGRDVLMDPYTGDVLRDGDSGTEQFFSTTTQIHRWFAMTGDSRATGRFITGYSNLLFLFLLVTGIYLWLPKIWNTTIVKTKVLFNPKAKSGKARDYNWHHVFSFWAMIPLFFIITSATVFYYPWANKMVYAAFGEEAPQRRGGSSPEASVPAPEFYWSQQALFEAALGEVAERGIDDWKTIAITTSSAAGAEAGFRIDRSIGGQPARQFTLTLNGTDGSVNDWRTYEDNSPGRQARSFVRFLHTGEVFGFIGQTLAGLASLAGCFLVWTGLALAWRRLIRPVFRRKAAAPI